MLSTGCWNYAQAMLFVPERERDREREREREREEKRERERERETVSITKNVMLANRTGQRPHII